MTRLLQTLLSLIASLLPAIGLATAQWPDVIHIDGEKHSLNVNPLRELLTQKNWQRPENAMVSSANWRGYIATWEIRDGQLVLVDATIRIMKTSHRDYDEHSIVPELFPSAAGAVRADWFSGALIIPQGELVHYVHLGYDSLYQGYQVIRIDVGQVIEHLQLSSEEFVAYKDRKFEEFITTAEFRKAFQGLRDQDDPMPDEEIIGFLKSVMTDRYLAR